MYGCSSIVSAVFAVVLLVRQVAAVAAPAAAEGINARKHLVVKFQMARLAAIRDRATA
jgi:hypothetical protein